MPKPNDTTNPGLLDLLRCPTCKGQERVGSILCPNCNNPIDYLVEGQDVREFYYLNLVDGKPNYEGGGDSEPREDATYYYCPECYDDMGFYNQERAIAFLKGEA